jgi:hypothetical protein
MPYMQLLNDYDRCTPGRPAGPARHATSLPYRPSHPYALNRSHSDLSLIDEDSSVLNSIFAKAADISTPARVLLLPCRRLDSDWASERLARDVSKSSHTNHVGHSRCRS